MKNASDAFRKVQTPANAVRLAIADHKAGGVVDHEFIYYLRKAEAICKAFESKELAELRMRVISEQFPS